MSLTRHAEQLNEWTGSYRYTEMEVVIVHTTVSTIISVSKQLKEFPAIIWTYKINFSMLPCMVSVSACSRNL